MNIAIIGYGKMGRLIEERARERGHEIGAVVDPLRAMTKTAGGEAIYRSIEEAAQKPGVLDRTELALEFTRPDQAVANIRALAMRKIPMVVGTTGWYGELEQVRTLIHEAGTALVWASNFSLGINLFYRIAAYAARLVDPFPEYDAGGWEAHHNKKADSPSGTAKILAERVLAGMSRKKNVVWETLNRPPLPEELHFASLRSGSEPGVHTILFDSPADTITLSHQARNREGLVLGALQAAEWLCSTGGQGRRRGVFTIDDVLEGILAARA